MGNINVFNTRFDDDRVVCLVKERSVDYGDGDFTVDSPEKAAELIEYVFDASNLTEEYIWLIALNCARNVAGLFEVSHGTLNSSLVHPRQIFSRAILVAAGSIILAHNHPSGSLKASDVDNEFTSRIKLSGEIIGIRLDDHIIVAGNEFVSAY